MAAKDKGLIPTGLFKELLNVMIDDQGKRLSALRSRVPNAVLLALFAIAAVAGAFAGFPSGLEKKSSRLPVYVMGFVVSASSSLSWTSIGQAPALSQTINSR